MAERAERKRSIARTEERSDEVTFNPDTDPHILENRRQTAEYNRQAEASMERLRKAMAQPHPQTPSPSSGEGEQERRSEADNSAIQDIEAPLQLSADDIVEGVEQDGKTVIHNVIQGERVLFSTVSQPLAFAFIQGHNTAAKAVKDVEAKKGDDGGDGEEGKGARRAPAEVDPKTGEKAEKATADNKPAPAKPKTDRPAPGSRNSGERETQGANADATFRKRAVL